MNNCIVTAAVALSLAIPTSLCTQGTPPPRSADFLKVLPASSKEMKGFSTGTTLFWQTNELVDQRLNRAKMLANSVRIDFDWAVIQPTEAGPYNWKETDRIVGAATRRGLGVVAMVGFAPQWARDPACAASYGCAPNDPAKFAAFAGQVAAHYKQFGIKKYEIWNEPNSPTFFGPQPNVTKYAAMLTQASSAIKAAQADAKVGSGGVAPGYDGGPITPPVTYVQQLYDAGASGFDAISVHPYNLPALPSQPARWSAFTQIEGSSTIPDMPTIHGVMAAKGHGNDEVWLTEYGAPTGGTGFQATMQDQHFKDFDTAPNSYVNEDLQAHMIDEFLYYKFSSTNVTVRMVHDFYDLASPGQSSSRQDYYGIFRKDGTPKQSITPFLRRSL